MNDTQLANDRTFLAWLRTGIALFGLGFVVAQDRVLVQPGDEGVSDKALYTGAGVLVVLSGTALVVLGYLLHGAVTNELKAEDDASQPRWPRTIMVAAVVGSPPALHAHRCS